MADWANFYVIVGSSAAALIGMQFVVMTLIANRGRRPPLDTLSAFGTPTMVHLGGALTVSAIMSVPWRSLATAAAVIVSFGAGGLAYGAIVFRRAQRQTYYRPVWQDWVWYVVLPGVAYAAATIGAALLGHDARRAGFVIAAAALSLLLIGIHNAWDTVTHLVVTDARAGGNDVET
jgi:hypothetical protein